MKVLVDFTKYLPLFIIIQLDAANHYLVFILKAEVIMDTITREKIIEALEAKGYVARATDKVNNSIIQHGIAISSQRICPVIYIDRFLNMDISKLDDSTEEIINIYCANYSCDINVDLFTDKEFILSHLYIALQNKEEIEDQLVKRDCELTGIEEYLYIRGESTVNGNWSVKLTSELMSTANLSPSECWNTAEQNTFNSEETTIRSMSDVLFDMTGCEDYSDFEIGLYVISNKSNTKGSVSILKKKPLRNGHQHFQ